MDRGSESTSRADRTAVATAGTAGEPDGLTIGELARRTGLSPATLRMWEARHGFPRPARADSGHRRYDPATVEAVVAVLRRQAAGSRLDAAIAETRQGPPGSGSVFAELRRAHPHLVPRMLRKRTLTALSHAIEDEYAAAAGSHDLLCGTFQHEQHLHAALPRWRDLARTSRVALVFAAGERGPGPYAPLVRVPLSTGTPLHREWTVVTEGTGLQAVLAAWELPGQEQVPDPGRVFESLWTVEPEAVRTAARVCVRAAEEAGVEDPLAGLAGPSASAGHVGDLPAAVRLFSRMVAYLDEDPAGG